MTAVLEVSGLRVTFPVKSALRAFIERSSPSSIDAVRNASISVERGQTLALVGESGAGKSTLALAVAGLERISDGSIRFDGEDVSAMDTQALRAYRRKVGYIWQNAVGSLSPRLTVKSIITEPAIIHRTPAVDKRDFSARLLELVGLPKDFADRYPHELSGGQARRVGIARALALNPSLIIADEPTAGLDVSVQGEILNLMNQLQDRLGVSILVITHNLNVVRHISDKIAIMYLGCIVEQGETAEIFSRPRHPYTLALLSASPKPDPDADMQRIELHGEIPSPINRPPGCEFHTRCPFRGESCDQIQPSLTTVGASHTLTCHYPR